MLDCRMHVGQISFASVLIMLTNDVHDHFPVWSPDGTRLAFMHWQHDHAEIYIMNAAGTGRQALTHSSAYVERRPNKIARAWSPDGEQGVENITDQLDTQYNGLYERMISWSW